MKSTAMPLLLSLLLTLGGCDLLFGAEPSPNEVLLAPVAGLSEVELRAFLAGRALFETHFGPELGLGPLFNEAACIRCHPGVGRGHAATNVRRFGRGDALDSSAFDTLPELGGPQLQNHAIAGHSPELMPADVVVSTRGAPPLAGLGLLEAVPYATLVALADPFDGDGDGISGRVGHVAAPAESSSSCDCVGCLPDGASCKQVSRFGRKAAWVSMADAVVFDLHESMGVTTSQLAADGGPTTPPAGDALADPELSDEDLASLVFFLRTLRAPERRSPNDTRVRNGEVLFSAIGCAACHVPALPTGPSEVAALSQITIHPYSDMLLHDMGPSLADGYPEAGASGNEWRTAPLWGVGLVPALLGGSEFYLHDGRALSLPEAIELHDGEARAAADAFAALGDEQRVSLLAFLRSL